MMVNGVTNLLIWQKKKYFSLFLIYEGNLNCPNVKHFSVLVVVKPTRKPGLAASGEK